MRRDPDSMLYLRDCDKCMAANSTVMRQNMRCGHEPPVAGGIAHEFKASKIEPETCPGYTTKLPEVLEVARARLHWGKGQLTTFTVEPPTEQLLVGIEILEGASNELESAMYTPESKGGLGKD